MSPISILGINFSCTKTRIKASVDNDDGDDIDDHDDHDDGDYDHVRMKLTCLLLDCIISDGGNHAEKEGSQSQPPL